MARSSVARPGPRGIREIDLVFERIHEKPRLENGEWVAAPVSGDEFALYRDSGNFPKKFYLVKEEAEELLGLIAEELGLTVQFAAK